MSPSRPFKWIFDVCVLWKEQIGRSSGFRFNKNVLPADICWSKAKSFHPISRRARLTTVSSERGRQGARAGVASRKSNLGVKSRAQSVPDWLISSECKLLYYFYFLFLIRGIIWGEKHGACCAWRSRRRGSHSRACGSTNINVFWNAVVRMWRLSATPSAAFCTNFGNLILTNCDVVLFFLNTC